ncbi:MAG: DUF2024 family protein, partial [Chitinophagaceae bacterium]
MKVSVFDTYVRKKDNGIMHFDILVSTVRKNIETIHEYGRHFMESKGQAGQPLTA